MRAIRAVREYNWAHQTGIASLVFHASPDGAATYVREADESFLLEPAAGVANDRDLDGLKQALALSSADAVWPGWGGLARSWELVRYCEAAGIRFVGPAARVLAHIQEPSELYRLVEGTGVAVTPQPPRPLRRLEVTVVSDGQGTIWPLGVLDCTVTRQLLRTLTSTPPAGLTPEEGRRVEAAAEAIWRRLDYQGLGAVEFYWDEVTRDFFFAELHPGLQPDHPTIEMATGLDLFHLQLHLARGGRLDGSRPATSGHAVGVRLQAEDSTTFEPAPGTIVQFRPPLGPGVRTDAGFDEHDVLAPQYDAHLAVVTARGTDRLQALSRLVRSLNEAAILVAGGTTNKGFLLWLLQRPDLRSGQVDGGWLDRLIGAGTHAQDSHSDVALIAASLEQYDDALRTKRARFLESAVRLRPQVLDSSDHTAELWYRGQGHRARVFQAAPDRFQVLVDGTAVEVQRERLGRLALWLDVHGRRYRVRCLVEGAHYRVEVDGILHTIERLGAIVVGAPHPAVVVRTLVSPGDVVSPGDPLVVLEAMKIENTLASEVQGRVRELLVRPNTQVGTGTALLRIDPAEKHVHLSNGAAPRVDVPGVPPEALPHRLRHFLLG
ncbi:MAG TPA: biotin carboxylase N-terminal domain-containing protein, partial [Candidatus Xenobia bacterium]